uniref:Uncharacterized protein n=1 Tax=Leersia perrieri TaxID=77586 RepID=A0A0D9X7H9_9ORYZ
MAPRSPSAGSGPEPVWPDEGAHSEVGAPGARQEHFGGPPPSAYSGRVGPDTEVEAAAGSGGQSPEFSPKQRSSPPQQPSLPSPHPSPPPHQPSPTLAARARRYSPTPRAAMTERGATPTQEAAAGSSGQGAPSSPRSVQVVDLDSSPSTGSGGARTGFMVALDTEPLVRSQERTRMIMSRALDEAIVAQVRALVAREVTVARREIEVAEGGAELAKIARAEGFIRKREMADIERRRGELVETFEDTMIKRHTINLHILTAMAAEEGVRTTTVAFIRELDDHSQELDGRAQELDRRDRVLRDAEATAANSDVELRVCEDALAERERALEAARQVVGDREAAVIRAEEDSAMRERNAAAQEKAIAEREATVEGHEAVIL